MVGQIRTVPPFKLLKYALIRVTLLSDSCAKKNPLLPPPCRFRTIGSLYSVRDPGLGSIPFAPDISMDSLLSDPDLRMDSVVSGLCLNIGSQLLNPDPNTSIG